MNLIKRINNLFIRSVISLNLWLLLTAAEEQTKGEPLSREGRLQAIKAWKGEIDPNLYTYVGAGLGGLLILIIIGSFIMRKIRKARHRKHIAKVRSTLKTSLKGKGKKRRKKAPQPPPEEL